MFHNADVYSNAMPEINRLINYSNLGLIVTLKILNQSFD
jgi:hypothetical protein